MREGKGKIYYNNRGEYGDFKNDFPEGKSLLKVQMVIYTGDFKNEKKEGKGVYIFSNRDKYDGDFKNDENVGYGIMYYKNGDRYEGSYKNGVRDG